MSDLKQSTSTSVANRIRSSKTDYFNDGRAFDTTEANTMKLPLGSISKGLSLDDMPTFESNLDNSQQGNDVNTEISPSGIAVVHCTFVYRKRHVHNTRRPIRRTSESRYTCSCGAFTASGKISCQHIERQ